MLIKIASITFCTCILLLYIGYICYECTQPIIGFWFGVIFILAKIILLCSLGKTTLTVNTREFPFPPTDL